jgi:hypothetical protein
MWTLTPRKIYSFLRKRIEWSKIVVCVYKKMEKESNEQIVTKPGLEPDSFGVGKRLLCHYGDQYASIWSFK